MSKPMTTAQQSHSEDEDWKHGKVLSKTFVDYYFVWSQS